MFNKNQRFVLSELSLRLWGVSSRWEKIYKELKLPDGHVESNKYVRTTVEKKFKDARGNIVTKVVNGPILREEKALDMGLLKEPTGQDGKTAVTRSATFEELFSYLVILWDSVVVGHASVHMPDKLMLIFAYRLAEGELNYPFKLQHLNYDNEELLNKYSQIVESFPVDIKDAIIKNTLSKEDAQDAAKSSGSMDAFMFVTTVRDRLKEMQANADSSVDSDGCMTSVGKDYLSCVCEIEDKVRFDRKTKAS